MRPKIVALVLFAALCAAGILALISKRPQPETPTPVSEAAQDATNSTASISNAVTAAPVASVPAPTNHAEYVRQRREELMNLAMHNDSASLETILSELQNPDRQIRKAALEATVQFSDRAAIPRLRDLASRTTNEDEKAEIEQAADYLALPSMTEYLAQQKAQAEAAGITNPPVLNTNRLSRRPPVRLPRPTPSVPANPAP